MSFALPELVPVHQYSHGRLGSKRSIRIMQLLPGKDDPLRCEIEEICLDSEPKPKFEALSYVWGAKDPQSHIICDGIPLPVTPNCKSALLHLRHRKNLRQLWVDAICIDQNSIGEKNYQIPLMSEIYSSAFQVIAWFGPGNKESTFVMNEMKRVRWSDSADSSIKEYSPTCKSAFAEIIYNPYFGRIWTCQEVAFARECVIMCGYSTVSWPTFVNAAQTLSSIMITPNQIQEGYSRGLMFREWVWNALRSKSSLRPRRSPTMVAFAAPEPELVVALLSSLGDEQSTDPKDKVYALYSILQLCGFQLDYPNYSKSTSSIYTEATAAAITVSGSLLLLSEVFSHHERLQDLPSWASDWSKTKAPLYQFRVSSSASKNSFCSARFAQNNSHLTVKGKRVGRIAQYIPESSRPWNYHPEGTGSKALSLFNKSLNHIKLLQECILMTVSVRDFLNLKVMMLRFFRFVDIFLPQTVWDPVALESLFRFLTAKISPEKGGLEWLRSLADESTPSWDDSIDVNFYVLTVLFSGRFRRESEYFVEIVDRLSDQALLKDSEGRTGITVHTAQTGDCIVILQGSDLPYVIRPFGESWRFIAVAYTEGLMDGEEWPEDEATLDESTLE